MWNHAICDKCWRARMREAETTDRIPVRAIDDTKEAFRSESCCWCRRPTQGIFVRDDPTTVPCGGKHADAA